MKTEKTIVPENRSPETIKNIFAVISYEGGKEQICRLSGTVEEKLIQYREFFGKDWNGHGEQVFSELVYNKTNYKPLFGGYEDTPMGNPHTILAQSKIDKLTALAEQYLDENKTLQEKKKFLTATVDEPQMV